MLSLCSNIKLLQQWSVDSRDAQSCRCCAHCYGYLRWMHGDPCCDADALSYDDPCDDGEQCAQECGGYDDGDDPQSALTQYVNYLN